MYRLRILFPQDVPKKIMFHCQRNVMMYCTISTGEALCISILKTWEFLKKNNSTKKDQCLTCFFTPPRYCGVVATTQIDLAQNPNLIH